VAWRGTSSNPIGCHHVLRNEPPAWLAFALITPVMIYVGWPIHKSGWLGAGAPQPGHELAHHRRHLRRLVVQLRGHPAPSVAPAKVRCVYYEEIGFILTLDLAGPG
jgi:Cu+-exporting ATPase